MGSSAVITQPSKYQHSDAMIAVGPSTLLHIDACIATPFAVRKGEPLEQSPAQVKILKQGVPPYNCCPEAVGGVAAVPMPPTLTGYVIDNSGDARMVVDVYRYDGVRYKSFEMAEPTQTGPTTFECVCGSWHYAGQPFTQTLFTPGGGSGAGLSLADGLLRATDLDAEINHALLCTLPPRFFGLVNPAISLNNSYCCGYATLPLGSSPSEGGLAGDNAWGVGATAYLKLGKNITGWSADAQRFARCAMSYGIALCDRDLASRKPEVVGLIGEYNPRIIALAQELYGKLELSDFFVGNLTKYNYHTTQYPVL